MSRRPRLLIANRGEIACRIIRSARALGFETWALYSDADTDALHVTLADHALHLGPAPASQSYLDINKVLAAAQRAEADLIHPGYGFLSENAAFAAACEQAGFIFVGPPSRAIEQMGDKAAAKNLLQAAGVPMVPGYQGDAQDDASLIEAAHTIGFPLLIKPSAGGGGKGMHIVHNPSGLPAALAQSRREAKSAFGDPRLLLERYLEGARHIELQIFFDRQGHGVYLFERDCSVQRRHQKVLEEAPAPGISPALRQRMGEAALAAGRAVGYCGAGTVEFLLDHDDRFFFMEMNTRLQVEHPVTELVTGVDLVAWQLRIAEGEPLPLTQDALALDGHAIEARIYAEDPDRGFLPASGLLHRLAWPAPRSWLRIDSGVREGDRIGIEYDPMLAKLIVTGPDRARALARLDVALAEIRLYGIEHNIAYLRRIIALPEYRQGGVDTGLIDRQSAALRAPEVPVDELLVLATLAEFQHERQSPTESPWQARNSWRLYGPGRRWMLWQLADGEPRELGIVQTGSTLTITLGAQSYQGTLTASGIALEGVRQQIDYQAKGDRRWLRRGDGTLALRLLDPDSLTYSSVAKAPSLAAPMPGVVVRHLVAAGTAVSAGTPLLLLEAMKMEHSLTAPRAGRVSRFYFAEGEQVERGAELLSFEADDDA